jgi:hypothetical protein
VADGQFAALGLILLGILAKLGTILGIFSPSRELDRVEMLASPLASVRVEESAQEMVFGLPLIHTGPAVKLAPGEPKRTAVIQVFGEDKQEKHLSDTIKPPTRIIHGGGSRKIAAIFAKPLKVPKIKKQTAINNLFSGIT